MKGIILPGVSFSSFGINFTFSIRNSGEATTRKRGRRRRRRKEKGHERRIKIKLVFIFALYVAVCYNLDTLIYLNERRRRNAHLSVHTADT